MKRASVLLLYSVVLFPRVSEAGPGWMEAIPTPQDAGRLPGINGGLS